MKDNAYFAQHMRWVQHQLVFPRKYAEEECAPLKINAFFPPARTLLMPRTNQAQAKDTQSRWVTLRQDSSGRLDPSKELLESLLCWPRGLVFT